MFMHDLAYNNRNLATIAAPDKSVFYSAFNIAKIVSVNGYKIALHSIVITILTKKTKTISTSSIASLGKTILNGEFHEAATRNFSDREKIIHQCIIRGAKLVICN